MEDSGGGAKASLGGEIPHRVGLMLKDKKIEGVLSWLKRRRLAGEVYATSWEETQVVVDQNRLKEMLAREGEGFGVRVFRQGRVGFSSTTRRERLPACAEAAAELARCGQPFRGALPCTRISTDCVLADPAYRQLRSQDLVDIVMADRAAVGGAFPKGMADVHLSVAHRWTGVYNTEGTRVFYPKTTFSRTIGLTLTVKKSLLQVYEGAVGNRANVLQEDIAARLLRKAEMGRREYRQTAAPSLIVFAPKAVDHLIGPLKMALAGKYLAQKVSPLHGKIGRRVFDEGFTLTDDPTDVEGSSAAVVDGEGVAPRRVKLVEQGTVRDVLLDLDSAARLRRRPNGHGFRSFASLPQPAPANWVIGTSDASLEDFLSEKSVLVVDQCIGWAGNPLSGQVAFNVELGFWYQKGKYLGRAKDVMLSGNLYDILSRDVMFGKEAVWVWGDLKTPPIAVRRMNYAQGGM